VVNVTWAMLGVAPTTSLALRDLWAHANLGSFAGNYSTTVRVFQ
jgi:hypothetical protein